MAAQAEFNNASFPFEWPSYDGAIELVVDCNFEKSGKIYSEPFIINGHEWRLLYYPQGNNVDFLSIYLYAVHLEVDPFWHRHAKFRLMIKSNNGKSDHYMEASHRFCPKDPDWGFTRFLSLSATKPDGNFVKNNAFTFVIETKVAPRDVLVSLVTEDDLRLHNPMQFDLIDFSTIPKKSTNESVTLEHYRLEQAERLDIPPERIRFWNWIKRKNKTCRVQRPYTDDDLKKELGLLAGDYTELRLLMEVSERSKSPYFDPYPSHADAKPGLLFFKYYDPVTQELSYVGNVKFDRSQKVKELLPAARKLLRLPLDAKIVFFEEVKPDRIDPLEDLEKTFLETEVMSGDILVIEKDYSPKERKEFVMKNCAEYYEHILALKMLGD